MFLIASCICKTQHVFKFVKEPQSYWTDIKWHWHTLAEIPTELQQLVEKAVRSRKSKAGKNRDIGKENGKSRDLSVSAMNTDKPALWIMFLSLRALITVFLVKTNPLVSEHLQSAGMFTANSWKKHKKRVSRQADPLTSVPLSPVASRNFSRGNTDRVWRVWKCTANRKKERKRWQGG